MRSEPQDRDPRELPAYPISEASHYLRIPKSTIRYWVTGRDHASGVVVPADINPILLSFYNLVEIHVLASLRRRHNVRLEKVREAVAYIEEKLPSGHPLLVEEFQTDGVSLFIEHLGSLVNLNKSGQIAMREILSAALQRIERAPDGLPMRLYPFTRQSFENSPTCIVIDPSRSGGRPVIKGTSISTEIIAERYKAGDSMTDLAADYERSQEEIEEAIRCEFPLAA